MEVPADEFLLKPTDSKLKHFVAWVLVDGQPARIFGRRREDEYNGVVCYIEAKEAAFEVCFADLRQKKGTTTYMVRLMLDGNDVGSKLMDSKLNLFKADRDDADRFRSFDRLGDKCSPWRFGDLLALAAHAELPEDLERLVGCISLRYMEFNPDAGVKVKVPKDRFIETGALKEDTKNVDATMQIDFGLPSGVKCDFDVLEYEDLDAKAAAQHEVESLTFLYRSREWLQASGYLPPPENANPLFRYSSSSPQPADDAAASDTGDHKPLPSNSPPPPPAFAHTHSSPSLRLPSTSPKPDTEMDDLQARRERLKRELDEMDGLIAAMKKRVKKASRGEEDEKPKPKIKNEGGSAIEESKKRAAKGKGSAVLDLTMDNDE